MQPLLALFYFILKPFLIPRPSPSRPSNSTFPSSAHLVLEHISRFLPNDPSIPISIQILIPRTRSPPDHSRWSTKFAMQDSSKVVVGGQDKVQVLLDNQRRVKDGRLVKKQPLASSKVVKSQGPHLKKSVNGYIIFRSGFPYNSLIVTVR